MTSRLAFLRRPLALVLAALAVFTAACIQTDPAKNPRTVMGPSALTADQLVWYFAVKKPPDGPLLTTTLPELAKSFVDEGIVENVRGDLAFVQALVETGWFRYGGQVQWFQNNFSGLGAVDGGDGGASFPNAATGVRAQIQHLRAYADPTAKKCAKPPLFTECVDTRFDLVDPKGKAPTWDQMGNGNWATDPGYSAKVIGLYNQMRTYYGLAAI